MALIRQTFALLLAWLLVGLVPGGLRSAAADDEGGFVRQFLACGPYRNLEPQRRLVGPQELPFEGHVTMGRLWVPVEARQDGFVNLSVLGPAPSAAALAHVYLHSEGDRDLLLLAGSDDRAQVTLNGRRVHGSTDKTGPWRPDQERVKVRLRKGWNKLLVRVWNNAGHHGFSVRFALPDGRPVHVRASATVPPELLDSPWLKRSLKREEVDELLALLANQVRSTMYVADRLLRAWKAEGQPLDRSYGQARAGAAAYVQALRDVLENVPAPGDAAHTGRTAERAQRRRRADQARAQLRKEVLQGPYMLTARTEAFLRRADTGAQLWDLVALAASTAGDAGRQAAEVNRALVAARELLSAVNEQYLRPFRLRENTLKHRTGELTLRFLQGDGSPIEYAEVSAEQAGHAFPFGCNLFAFEAFGPSAENRLYLRRFAELFNTATVPMYWSLLEFREGRLDFDRDIRGLAGPEPMVRWCRSMGIRVRGSPLLANEGQPAWLREKPPEEAARLVEAHVRRVVQHFKGRIDYWEVNGGAWPQLLFGKLRLGVDYPVKWADQVDGQAELLVSYPQAWGLVSAARKQVRQPFGLDGVALPAYQTAGPWTEQDLEANLDRIAKAGLPVHLTRVMIAGPARDEAAQARAVEAFYRTAFAHPAVRSIAWHDLSDRFAAGGRPGGLLRKDLTTKPAYHALARLIRRQWHTLDEGRCDSHGKFRFRGYFGRYRIRATLSEGAAPRIASWEIDLSPDGPKEIQLSWPPAP